MKKVSFLFAVTVILSAVSALADDANLLVELKQSPGASVDQRAFDLKVTSKGEVTLTTTAFRLNYVANKSLANLSDDIVVKLQQLVAAVPLDAQLTDANPDQPQCTDAPTAEIAVFKGDQTVKISSKTNCHELQVQDNEACKTLSDLIYSLLSASNIEVSE